MDITKPIATPIFGGMITSTIYVLFLIPCLFAIGEDIRRRWPERFPVERCPSSRMCLIVASCGQTGRHLSSNAGPGFRDRGKGQQWPFRAIRILSSLGRIR